MANIVLLQHGPSDENCIARTCAELARVKDQIAKHNFSIVFQYYNSEQDYARSCTKSYQALGFKIRPVETSDLFNPGFFNINRQTYTVSAALKEVADDDIVIKLRNDQFVNFDKLFQRMSSAGFFDGRIEKILTTNCFTRKDRLYHPSDMFLCSSARLLKQYYSLPYQEETHMDTQLKIAEMESNGVSQRLSMLSAPESQLFVNFLKLQGWDLKFTDEDSLASIQKYCFLVNSWNIDFSWEKKRTPGIKAGGIILPQNNLQLPPFERGPKENIACFDEVDIHGGQRSLMDVLYVRLSKALFAFCFDVSAQATHARVVRYKNDGCTATAARLARKAAWVIIAKIRRIAARIAAYLRRKSAMINRLCRLFIRLASLFIMMPFLLFVRSKR